VPRRGDRRLSRRDQGAGTVGYLPAMWRDFAITAILLVAPQPGLALGAELLAAGLLCRGALFIRDRRAGHDRESGVARYIDRASPNVVTALLIGIAGLTFLLKAGGGLYWMIPAVLASLAGGVINAWLFLIKVPVEASVPAPGESPRLRSGTQALGSSSLASLLTGSFANRTLLRIAL